MHITVGRALRQAIELLLPVAGEEAGQQAGLLIAHVLGCEPGALPSHRNEALDLVQQAQLNDMLERRRRREPLQYLLGEWGFMGLSFWVTPHALIPRQDTETLCELGIKMAREKGYCTALDLCCGTGCVGIALAKWAGLAVTAADISLGCVELTQRNARRNKVELQSLQSNWFAGISQSYDLIVCNPPYLSQTDMQTLQPELVYEPSLALDGGQDGLDAYRCIAAGYETHLNPGGMLLLEVGSGQAEAVQALFGGGYSVDDLAGIPRVVCLEKP